MTTSYDVIGDIHGHAAKLEALLRQLGYVPSAGSWIPPQGRTAVFVGDLIDRGPEQMRVVHIVRSMIDAGHARAIMGNHEFNAIAFATPRRDEAGREVPGEFLREHSEKNIGQHAEFLAQVKKGPYTHEELIEWFRQLPPMLDLDGIRVVHAWWHEPYVDLVASRWAPGTPMSNAVLVDASTKDSPMWNAMEGLTKGLEIRLPEGLSFLDHAGNSRHAVRTKWWLDEPRDLGDVAIFEGDQGQDLSGHPIPADYLGAPVAGSPVFIGHYWMTGRPKPMSRKVACLDWSAAKNGPLVAYRWDGEHEIDPNKFHAAG